jgi:hypothetical protein
VAVANSARACFRSSSGFAVMATAPSSAARVRRSDDSPTTSATHPARSTRTSANLDAGTTQVLDLSQPTPRWIRRSTPVGVLTSMCATWAPARRSS